MCEAATSGGDTVVVAVGSAGVVGSTPRAPPLRAGTWVAVACSRPCAMQSVLLWIPPEWLASIPARSAIAVMHWGGMALSRPRVMQSTLLCILGSSSLPRTDPTRPALANMIGGGSGTLQATRDAVDAIVDSAGLVCTRSHAPCLCEHALGRRHSAGHA